MGYMLRKGSRKDVCPACGRRTFTPYVDGDGTVLDPAVGMCDRKNKCNYHLPPRVFLNMHAGDSGPGGRHVRFKPSRHAVRYSPPEMIPRTTVGDTLRCYERNALVAWLKGVFRDGEFAAALDKTLARYKVGTSKAFGGSPVFWLIDHRGGVRDGKIMGYDRTTGKRVKHPRPLFTNVHTRLAGALTGGKGGEWKPCFFGAHLVEDNVPVWLFESEKAALIAAVAIEWGGVRIGVPMATGGCSNFNPSPEAFRDPWNRHKVLENRDVVLFPDEGKYGEWLEKGRLLTRKCPNVWVSTVMEPDHPRGHGLKVQPGDGFDDLIVQALSDPAVDLAHLLLTAYRDEL